MMYCLDCDWVGREEDLIDGLYCPDCGSIECEIEDEGEDDV